MLTYHLLGPRTHAIHCNKVAVERLFQILPERSVQAKRPTTFGYFQRRIRRGPPRKSKNTNAFVPHVKEWFDARGLQWKTGYTLEWNNWNVYVKFRKKEDAILFKLAFAG